MQRFLVLIILLTCLISGCRYWVLYKFADQFCDYDQYIAVELNQDDPTAVLAIQFMEPVLDRPILLRYLNAEPFLSHYQEHAVIMRDDFAFSSSSDKMATAKQVFQFSLGYHALDESPLLSDARLDPRLSELFTPALVEPILRSICSDDYDLSDEQLDMRFKLATLDRTKLPNRQQIQAIIGQAQSIDALGDSYHFDFLLKDQRDEWQPQYKPVNLVFGFEPSGKLAAIHISYFKYRYWLDLKTRSGRLLVLRG